MDVRKNSNVHPSIGHICISILIDEVSNDKSFQSTQNKPKALYIQNLIFLHFKQIKIYMKKNSIRIVMTLRLFQEALIFIYL